MDTSTKAAGLTLKTPLLPGSGPLTGSAERMLYLARQGLGAVVTKTIAPEGAQVGRPCIAGGKDIIFNSEAWSEYPAKTWLEDYLPTFRKACDTPLIISMGYDAEDMKLLVPQLEPFASGYEYIPRYVGKDFDEVGRIVSTIRSLTDKPLWIKMNASISDPVGFAAACRDNGAQGVTAVTSLGPNMVIDIPHRRPLIGTDTGYVWTSGPAIKPLALAYVNMIKEAFPDLSILASGGCTTADDVIEFLLAGADAVQMLSAPMLKGRDWYGKVLAELPERLAFYGFESVEDVKRTGLTKSAQPLEPSFPKFDREKCTGCGLCARNCPYFALTMDGKTPVVDESKCFGCGLCQTRCPATAITNVLPS